jgi:polyisoprenoid-binding protein YceI
MFAHRRTLTIAAFGLAPLLAGWMYSSRLNLEPGSRLWIEGVSTVRPFKCVAGVIEADVVTARAGAVSALVAGEKVVTSVGVRVPAAKLDCSNETMNGHMRKALKSDVSPMITFDVASYELMTAGTQQQAKLTGTLNLGGTARPITVDAVLVQDPAGSLRVKGSYDLRMTEYGLKPPTLMMGTMKVKELVKVNFDLLLKD